MVELSVLSNSVHGLIQLTYCFQRDQGRWCTCMHARIVFERSYSLSRQKASIRSNGKELSLLSESINEALLWCVFDPGFVNYKKGALDSQPHVIKFTSCLLMVDGSLRLLPPL
jgi:hypothetical protein